MNILGYNDINGTAISLPLFKDLSSAQLDVRIHSLDKIYKQHYVRLQIAAFCRATLKAIALSSLTDSNP